MFITSSSSYPIGLDISDLSLKLFQLNRSGDKIKIQAVGKYNLPRGLIEDGEIKNKAEVLKAIDQLIDKPKFGKISSKEIIACLPETKTFIKLIEVDITPNDFNETIKTEIEKHIPMSIDEIYYDWQLIKKAGGKQFVLIAAAPKTIVDQYSQLFSEAGLSLIALEIESVAICRSLLAEEHYKFKGAATVNYGIIDIGAKRTSMTVYSGNTILLTMSIPISGEKITEEIAKSLKIDMNLAEKAKIICGFDENRAQGIVKNILNQMIEDLIGKLKEVIKYYSYHFPNQGPINKLLLCGGGAKIENIDKILSQALSLDISMGDPLRNLNEERDKFTKVLQETHKIESEINSKNAKNKPLSLTQDNSLTYTTAIGLALRGIFFDR